MHKSIQTMYYMYKLLIKTKIFKYNEFFYNIKDFAFNYV